MKHSKTVSAALACVLALGTVQTVQAADANKEKCYGVAKAGQNDCANLSGSHSCAGMAKTDGDPGEWKLVPKGSCKPQGGLSHEEARARYKSQQKG